MSRYSLQEFVSQTAQQELNQGTFELESDRMLEVNLNGLVWMKMGAMVSYRGQVKFTREGILEQGLGNLLKKAVSGEGTKLTKAEEEAIARKKADDERLAQTKLDNCSRANAQMKALQDGQRMSRINAQGQREFLDDKGRAEEIQRTQQVISTDCKR